jgi:hypothetical protein
MTNQEILTKAIEKAIANGWTYWLYKGFARFEVRSPVDMLECLVEFTMGEHHQVVNQQHVIFNHSFAQALWGELDIMQECKYCKTPMGFQHPNPCPFAGLSQQRPIISVWRYHLQQMVIADNPIAYLGEHL